MQVVSRRCGALEVRQTRVVACVLRRDPEGTVHREAPNFGAMTADLLALTAWLTAWLTRQRVPQVALARAGNYWRPGFNGLEAAHDRILGNADHLKTVGGHKTEVKDAEGLADRLRQGLVRASFIPPAPMRALREVTRYRPTLVHERTQQGKRRHKLLESATRNRGAVATDSDRQRPTS